MNDLTNRTEEEVVVSSSAIQIQQLRSIFNGQVLAPGDDEYDDARRVNNGAFDRLPAVIIRPTDATEVARVVGLARDSGIRLSVRSGGHSWPGHSVIDDGIVLDLGAMRSLEIDADARTAWAQTGVTAGEYTAAAAEHGLATGLGDTGSVGLGGITLGGGVGFLSRKHGLTIDDLLAAEIVTADGKILNVDADNHPDLFWAIRGGGGNFGVVTRFKYRLHEVPSIVGGMLMLPATAENIAAFVAAAEAAPEELSTIASVMPAPPLPFLPAELHGQVVLVALLCFAGPADTGERVIAPFRAIAAPIADMVKPMPYPGMYAPESDQHPAIAVNTLFVDHVDVETAETMMQHVTNSDAPMRLIQIRVLGGAISRVSSDTTAYAHRNAKIMANVLSIYTGPDDEPVRQQWIDSAVAALDQGVDGAYVNFATGNGPERLRAMYPEATLQRLSAIKAQYDPTNLFDSNHNIPPAA